MPVDPSLVREFAPTGTLRAVLNMGNPVLTRSRTAPERPAGVTIDLARAFAALLGVPVQLIEVATPGESVAALSGEQADIGFIAVDPLRAAGVHFTPPYVEIEGCYLVRNESPITRNEEVDRPGVRISTGINSAYELFLKRALTQATLVSFPKSEAVVDAMLQGAADVAAGVRQQLEADAARVGGVRLLPGRFMAIHQAMALPRVRSAEARAALDRFVEDQKTNGFVAASLERHGIGGARVAPPASAGAD